MFITYNSYVSVEVQWFYIIPNLYLMCMCTHIIILLDFTKYIVLTTLIINQLL